MSLAGRPLTKTRSKQKLRERRRALRRTIRQLSHAIVESARLERVADGNRCACTEAAAIRFEKVGDTGIEDPCQVCGKPHYRYRYTSTAERDQAWGLIERIRVMRDELEQLGPTAVET